MSEDEIIDHIMGALMECIPEGLTTESLEGLPPLADLSFGMPSANNPPIPAAPAAPLLCPAAFPSSPNSLR